MIPYFGYARQDRKDEGRVPITAKLVANLIERAGADRVLAIDLHAAQMQGFFDIPVDHLHAEPVFTKWFQSLNLTQPRCSSRRTWATSSGPRCTPTAGRRDLHHRQAAQERHRRPQAVHIIGDVEGKNVLMVDDMITTAGTVTEAVQDPARRTGPRRSTWRRRTRSSRRRRWSGWPSCPFTKLVVTDTIPIGNRADAIKDRLVVLSVAELLGEAIHRIHHNESVSALFDETNGREH